MDRERMAGREIESPDRVFIPNLECDVSRLSGIVSVLSPPVQTQILLCPPAQGCNRRRNFALSLAFVGPQTPPKSNFALSPRGCIC